MVVASLPQAGKLDLDGTGLLVATLQSESLPIRRIPPAPCTQACPAGINVQAYVSLIAERRFAEALEVIRRRCPLPGICGRVCDHPCEAACRRGNYDDPVAIRALKRFVADLEQEFPTPTPPQVPLRNEKVAVIGSGPAGLTAAYDLRRLGYRVTVFEAESEPGGMLRYGITAYRLPRDVLDAEIEVLARAGVEIRTGRRLGDDLQLEGLLRKGYDAVLLAVGAQVGRRLPLSEGADHSGVEDALAFLRRANAGDRSLPGKNIIVIGGGSTAVEAARTALRLGAESVEIIYRRYREELLASAEEIEAAESEGVRLRFLAAPLRAVVEHGRIKALQCVRIGLGEPDNSRRRRPINIPGSEFSLPTDYVLAAVGQEADLGFLSNNQRDKLANQGRLVVDAKTVMTQLPGVFAAGDGVSGPATVIEAIASAHRAAESIRHYIEEGRPGIWEKHPGLRAAPEYELIDGPPIEARRVRPAVVPPTRGREFAEVEQAFTADEALAEAQRCLRCGPCGECQICASSCRRRHIMLRTESADGATDGAANGSAALIRAPANIAMSFSTGDPTPGWLLPDLSAPTLPQIDTANGMEVKLTPARSRVREALCRGCASCVDVCPFQAITVSGGADSQPQARIESALCRGCDLCTAVCPTNAAVSSAFSPPWWRTRLQHLFDITVSRPQARPYVVLACQRRAGGLETFFDENEVHVEVIGLRCLGHIDAGMLLELGRHGAHGVIVAGCHADRCRFQRGARMAAEQVERARSVLRYVGADERCILADWSEMRAHDPLQALIQELIAQAPSAKRPVASGTG